MSDDSNMRNTGGGAGFGVLLGVLFIGLKLTGHINWSWLWVLSPIWISWGLVLLIFGVMFLAFSLN